MQTESLRWIIRAEIDKWHTEEDARCGSEPYEHFVCHNNLVTTVGIQQILDFIIGTSSGGNWGAASVRIGVGDGVATPTVADLDLSAAATSAHRQFVVMDATYPSRNGNIVTWRSTFTAALGNFAWNEWAMDQGTGNGTTVIGKLLNHKLISGAGTKQSGQQWLMSTFLSLA